MVVLVIANLTRGLYLLDFSYIESLGVHLAFAIKIKTDLGLLLAINTFFYIIRVSYIGLNILNLDYSCNANKKPC